MDLSKRRDPVKAQLLETLFHEHGAALRGFLQARLGTQEEVEDIVQDVFVRLARLKDLEQRLQGGGLKNRSFIYKIANNLIVDLERHKLVRSKYAEVEQARQKSDPPKQMTPEKAVSVNEDLDYLKTAVMKLRPKWREAFLLSRMMQMTYPEIAEEMNVSVKQVEKYMKNALIHIRYAVQVFKESNGE